ncbi:MAG: amino acid racemase [Oscillospiraceae bacterium]|nr:amino acid racemase [Oscillospiraceae bacterium]
MKKLGLIGGTGPESTIVYYKEITGGVQKQLNQNVFPPLSIESLSVFEVLKYCNNQDYDGLLQYLLSGINNLAGAGAEYAALTGITPHIVYEDLSKKSPIPIISMVGTACEFSKKKHHQKIALLGTLPTMKGSFFQKEFAINNISVITASEKEMSFISNKIEKELEFGIVNDATVQELKGISLRLYEEEKVDAIVLGCTELPLAFDNIDLPIEKMDVMRIHIEALISLILSE